MPTNSLCCPTTDLPAPAVGGPPLKVFDQCTGAQPVVICGAPAPVDITLTGADCLDVPVNTTAPEGQIAYGVQPAGHVYTVKLCPSATDRELLLLCDTNGDKVALQYDVNTQPPTLLSAFNLNTNAVYAGPVASLAQCGQEKLDFVGPYAYCDSGIGIHRTDIVDAQLGVVVGQIWTDDATGAQIPAPAAATMGVCSAARRIGIYLERNGGVVTAADIVAATGTTQLQSITVKQMSGRGNITADAGSGVPLDAGEVWSWSALSGADFQDTFSDSTLSMDAAGGEQRITATYVR